jgi:two-component system response regulator RegX3
LSTPLIITAVREDGSKISGLPSSNSSTIEQVVSFGDVEVNFERRDIRRGGEEVKFTRTEYNLLEFFVRNSDRPFTRSTILKRVWGYDGCLQTRTVDAHVVKLRQKLEPDPSAPRHFLTIHGVGYRFRMNRSRPRELDVAPGNIQAR